MAITATFKLAEAVALSKTPAKVLIRWEMTGPSLDMADLEFYVESGESQQNKPGFQHVDIYQEPMSSATEHTETANLTTISKAIDGLDNQWYLDMSPELANLSKSIVYRVRCRKKSTQEEIYSEMFDFDGTLDLTGLYVVDETNFLLEDVTGTPCLVYNRRRGGLLCDCFDKIQKKRTRSGCTTCFDTNWVGGFYDPIDSYVDFTPNPKNATINPWGETQDNESQALMSNFPQVNYGDVIRELRENRMWRVERVNVTEKRRSNLLQFPVVSEIKPGDVEYKIPVDEQFLLKKVREFEATKKKREF